MKPAEPLPHFFFFKQKTAYEMLRSLVGSEMCIRDRHGGERRAVRLEVDRPHLGDEFRVGHHPPELGPADESLFHLLFGRVPRLYREAVLGVHSSGCYSKA